ncbi:Glycoside hydrolase [Parasponia andersonii]|uniref:Endoglucanase n=1 Tax=Parasponia andersonii TaxID=3476 RepID=A0A2P5DSM6_PARAD|nr:Glycoside hydrolase [Parasponia andersonii]
MYQNHVTPLKTLTRIFLIQVGTAENVTKTRSDINCWQRPEDMEYPRPVSSCDSSAASDLAGEIVAALSAASIAFKEESDYSKKLVKTAEELFDLASRKDPSQQGTYTRLDDCGREARNFYNSSGYLDELVWGGTWLFFATGNTSHLEYATGQIFTSAQSNETSLDKGLFYWNNKFTANAVLLTRLQFFNDLGFPYESAMSESASMINSLMCSYVSGRNFNKTAGGLVLQRPENGAPILEFAATASFLSKLYSDYLQALRRSGASCGDDSFSIEMLRTFSTSQASLNNLEHTLPPHAYMYMNYILGDNPMKMSYMVGFGGQYPTQVHHRSASIPWDGHHYKCEDGDKWLQSKDPNPNILIGAMVAGPDQSDKFLDQRDKPLFTEPSISSNAGLVAALIALHDPPPTQSSGTNLGIDISGLFGNIRL